MIVNRDIESPRDFSYAEILRFLVQTADIDDPSLNLTIDIWSSYIKNGTLTTKETALIDPYIDASQKKYKWGVLNAK